MMIGIALMWWVLVKPTNGRDFLPIAMGPYPSEQMCIVAARDMMPDEQQFWTQAERDAFKKKQKAEQEAREREIASTPPSKDGWVHLKDGSSVRLDADGHVVGIRSGSVNVFIINGVSYLIPLTGCEAIETPEKR